jgi:hypothetical protein
MLDLRTESVSIFTKVVSMEVNGSKNVEVKKAGNDSIQENMAPPIGLGPMTNWLTARRST